MIKSFRGRSLHGTHKHNSVVLTTQMHLLTTVTLMGSLMFKCLCTIHYNHNYAIIVDVDFAHMPTTMHECIVYFCTVMFLGWCFDAETK